MVNALDPLVRRYVSEILHDYQAHNSRGVVFGLRPIEHDSECEGWRQGDLGNSLDRVKGQEVVARVRFQLERLCVDCAIRHAPGIENPRNGLVLGWTLDVADPLN